MCHTGYHPSGCGATANFGPTKYRYTLMAIKKQTMRHTGYHPTGCGATADFGPTKYRYTLMAIKNHRALKKQKQRDVIKGRRMIQDIQRALKNNRTMNRRNKYMQSRNKQTMRHTGYHPTGYGATADSGPTKYR